MSRCSYCGFFGGNYSEEQGLGYVEALKKHMADVALLPAARGKPIEAVYFGGGTPTELPANSLRELLSTVRSLFPLADDCEITMEGRVSSLTPEKMEACLAGGANRFSIGVQSFHTDLRRMLGRLDDQETVCRTLEKLASYNQASIVIDLLYGLPGQTLEDWAGDLAIFDHLPLDGVDLYQLMVFPGSNLFRTVKNGTSRVAHIHEQGAFFRNGVETMESNGCRRLSLCHWGRSERERNIYNCLSKQRENCLAFGCGAGGMVNGYFYYSNRASQQYIRSVMEAGGPFASTSLLVSPPRNARAMQRIIGQMEMGHLDLTGLSSLLEDGELETVEPLLANWKEAGLLDESTKIFGDGAHRRIDLTIAGQFWQVNMSQGLISTLCGRVRA
jgi:oxygen-independent coproporphyrinogen-3 oxidase